MLLAATAGIDTASFKCVPRTTFPTSKYRFLYHSSIRFTVFQVDRSLIVNCDGVCLFYSEIIQLH